MARIMIRDIFRIYKTVRIQAGSPIATGFVVGADISGQKGAVMPDETPISPSPKDRRRRIAAQQGQARHLQLATDSWIADLADLGSSVPSPAQRQLRLVSSPDRHPSGPRGPRTA
jgi:hypothetical protein